MVHLAQGEAGTVPSGNWSRVRIHPKAPACIPNIAPPRYTARPLVRHRYEFLTSSNRAVTPDRGRPRVYLKNFHPTTAAATSQAHSGTVDRSKPATVP